MLVKCETKSHRVKGLSFHPQLHWILVSLHNGVIQLWDFIVGSLIERFEEHEGPVRGVCFHHSQPIFVSGGDDYKIKVWNYRQRRCIFTLLGHLDYIRTVYFHPEYPWILSSSDDQTVRLWNWQSRNCVAVLAGHNHYVMCAQFHPKQDLVVSASLDQTIRLWDVTGLREKTVSIRGSGGALSDGGGGSEGPGLQLGGGLGGSGSTLPGFGSSASHQHSGPMGSAATDVFGISDAICKFVLEGHDRGVNWAAFHPTMPLIASGADDRLVKLWRFNESKWWEVDTFRGHYANVSSVLFHPTKDLILSNSEDRTIRVWDITKRILVHTFRRENDRFWILAGLANSNLIAVGHDSGMVVFKLGRERPAFDVYSSPNGSEVLHVKDKWITATSCAPEVYATGSRSIAIAACRRLPNAMASGPRSLACNHLNPTEYNVLVHYAGRDLEGSQYDLLIFKDPATAAASPASVTTRTGNGVSMVFTARNRFAVLVSVGASYVNIYNLNNELTKKIDLPADMKCAKLFFCPGNNKLLFKSEEMTYLYDLTSKKILGEVSTPAGSRYAIWSHDNAHVALICKHHVVIASANLKTSVSIHESIRVKGGAWDSTGAFVYSTLSHIKYLLPNGDHGMMRSLSQPVYIVKAEKQRIWVLDREGSEGVRTLTVNCVEYLFKLALHRKQFDQVALLLQKDALCGNAIVHYLRKNGHPEVALQFTSDLRTTFNLSLENGNLSKATSAAVVLDDKSCWERLGHEAMRHGHFQTAEVVFQKTKNFDKLSFLYLITGNIEKLKKMQHIAQTRNDFQSRFHNALMLGDVEERVRILAEVGQLPLAALAAKAAKLDELTQILNESIEGVDLDSFLNSRAKPPVSLRPPLPLITDTSELKAFASWPRSGATGSKFENALEQATRIPPEIAQVLQNKLLSSSPQHPTKITRAAMDPSPEFDEDFEDLSTGEDAWGDLDVGDLGERPKAGGDKETPKTKRADEQPADPTDPAVVYVEPGTRPEDSWVSATAPTPLYNLIAAGHYDDALETLSKRIGLINAEPLKPIFESIATGAFVYLPLLPDLPVKRIPCCDRGEGHDESMPSSPVRMITPQTLFESARDNHRLVTNGKFEEALHGFRRLLHELVFAEADSTESEAQLTELLATARIYVTAMMVETERQRIQENSEETQRNIELAAYLGCCKMQPAHRFLALRRAMTVAWRAQNAITAATFARRIIQGNFSNMKGGADAVAQAKKLLILAEKKGTDRYHIDFETTDSDDLVIDVHLLKRIPPREATTKCPYCGAVAVASSGQGRLCPICLLSEMGARVLGLRFKNDP